MPTAVAPISQPLTPQPRALSPNTKPTKPQAYVEAVKLQRLLSQSADELAKDVASSPDSDCRARASSSLAQLVKSWDCLEQRKRILRGLGNPKAVEAKNAKPKRKKTNLEMVHTEDGPDQTETGEGIS